jgi:SAM-dependent methyltransferase
VMECGAVTADLVVNPRWESLETLVDAHGGPGDLVLDLGCGYANRSGVIGLDDLRDARAQLPAEERAPDLLLDLAHDRLPFPDGACREVHASHFLEHISHDRLAHVFDEVARVLRPGGRFVIAGPYANSAEGLYPGHATFFTEKWFRLNPVFQEHFEIVEERFVAGDDWDDVPWIIKRILPFDLARRLLFNVCREMHVVGRRR